MALSIDLRERVIAAIDDGMRITDAAKSFRIGRKSIYRWLDLRKKTNSIAPKSGYQKGHSHKITDWEKFREFVKKHRHLIAAKMAIEWGKITNVYMSPSAMQRSLKKIGYTSKKNIWVYRS